METKEKITLKGGEFLIKETAAGDIFIPEEIDEEQKMIYDMANDFLKAEIHPILDRIDSQEEGLLCSLVKKAGEQGLLGTAIPEEYGGFGKDFITNMILTEAIGSGHSFAVALAVHTGIGSLPVLYFGTKEQKEKYLPKFASGELMPCYCLTEAGSGSDALSAKTKAILSDDGKHYILNGDKMFITNAGFADVFIVFAQIDGDKFTGFIIDKDSPGLSMGEEEHKMGIKGSSTRQVFLSDCKVPAENVLGEIGKGHKIAFNILNIGRVKLAGAVNGAAKHVSTAAIQYANERVQFKQPIARFGAIQHKLAEQAIQIYACESALYRVSYNINEAIKIHLGENKHYAEALLEAAEEYAIECAIMKVFGSEMLDFVVDEGVQILGGYGYSAEYPMDRAYRDSRINRIFEGTSEINRLLTFDMLMKRAMKGQIDLMTSAKAIQGELMSVSGFGEEEDDALFTKEKKIVSNLKKACLMAAGATVQKFMLELAAEQEIIMNISDMIIETYICESLILRTEKLVNMNGEEDCKEQIDMMRVYINDATDKVNVFGKRSLCSWAEGDELRIMLMGLKRFTKMDPVNTKDARRRIANRLSEENKYCF
ncbi:MAG: acyl-CoA dehydrogenase family protein [Bacteroidota bacterium]